LEKVFLRKCTKYKAEEVRLALEDIIDGLGGIDSFVEQGDKVFLKLNLLMRKKPEEAVTTHPVVVEELVKIIKDKGAEVIIGDSPGGPYTLQMLKSIYKASGMEEVAERTGAVLNYDLATQEVTFSTGHIAKSFTICKPMLECDKLIAVSKLKTHGMTKFTGAVKVLFGAIPGLIKAEYHLKMPNIFDFSNMLVDLSLLLKPSLSIMDGIVGMEGAGPSAGSPRQINALLGSTNPFALDVVASSIIGMEPLSVPTIKVASQRELPASLKDIEILGNDLGDFKIDDFIMPIISGKSEFPFPKAINNLINRALNPKPVFREDICVKCNDCVKLCPPKALNMGETIPKVDLDKCIRCFCCQELCPKKAIEIKRSWLSNVMFNYKK
jgi:uncharacterized protein (DUF362 family)/Pyruvate/2-oxoacid:ferredoxin oxidoreductase delta subunit